MLDKIVKALYAVRDWWQSDAVSSKAIRVPFKLALVGAAAVIALTFASFGAGKLRAYSGEAAPATQTQVAELHSQLVAKINATCQQSVKVAPVKKSKK